MSETYIEVAADLISAFLSNNSVPASEVPQLLAAVHGKIVQVATGEREAKPEATPALAISIKKSITKDALICLECGRGLKTLKRHLFAEHGLTTGEYKSKFSLPNDYPTTAPGYSATRSSMAILLGLGKKVVEAAPVEVEPTPATQPKKSAARKAEPKLVRAHPKSVQTRKRAKGSKKELEAA